LGIIILYFFQCDSVIHCFTFRRNIHLQITVNQFGIKGILTRNNTSKKISN
jgi:hypothetical protein